MREREYLIQRYRAIIFSVGMMLVFASGLMTTPLLALPAYPEEMVYLQAFLFPAGCLFIVGVLFMRIFRCDTDSLTVQEGGIIVLVSWIVIMGVSAWPFLKLLDLPFSRGIFESVSGWTTTGLSVVDVDRAPKLILLWRSIIQLAGGAGLAIIMMSAIVGPTGVGISSAEGRSNQLVPQVRQSARLVLWMYSCYALAGTLAYWGAGMSLFDAVNHAFAAISTGGFSTRPESIGYWHSPAIEAVTIILMLLGSLNFVTAWYLWRGQVGVVGRNGEIRLACILMPMTALGVFLVTCRSLYAGLSQSVRVAVFEAVSAMTTTGFTLTEYRNWNSFGIFTLILLMLIGGGTCSTAGGIKQFRIYLLWKQVLWEIRRLLMPGHTVLARPMWEGNHLFFVDDGKIRQTAVFVCLYLTIYAAGAMVLCACGYSIRDALFEFSSAVGTVGLSLGVTSANMPDPALWAEIMAMFMGRLEITVILVSFIKLARDGWLIMKKVPVGR